MSGPWEDFAPSQEAAKGPWDKFKAGPTKAPPAAIDMLKKNPDMASLFDSKYGQGASKKHLGN